MCANIYQDNIYKKKKFQMLNLHMV